MNNGWNNNNTGNNRNNGNNGWNNQQPQQGWNNQQPQNGWNNQRPQQNQPQQGWNNQQPQQGWGNQTNNGWSQPQNNNWGAPQYNQNQKPKGKGCLIAVIIAAIAGFIGFIILMIIGFAVIGGVSGHTEGVKLSASYIVTNSSNLDIESVEIIDDTYYVYGNLENFNSKVDDINEVSNSNIVSTIENFEIELEGMLVYGLEVNTSTGTIEAIAYVGIDEYEEPDEDGNTVEYYLIDLYETDDISDKLEELYESVNLNKSKMSNSSLTDKVNEFIFN